MNKIYGFWIDPKGNIYQINDEVGHKVFMEKYFHKIFNSDEDVYNQTLNEGWIRIVNKREFIVNYMYIICRNQLSSLKNIDNILQENGYFHDHYYLEYRNQFYDCDSMKHLIRKIKERSC